MKKIIALLLALIPLVSFAAPEDTNPAEESGKPLQVGLYGGSASVDIVGEELSGFDVDLWKSIADENEIAYDFNLEQNFSSMMDKVKGGQYDVAISTITITEDRMSELDFTFPYYESGLALLTLKQQDNILEAIIKSVLSPSVWKILLIFGAIVFIFANVIWLLERNAEHNRYEQAVSPDYFPGIFEAMWYAFIVNSHVHLGHDKVKNCHWLTRLISIPLWIVGLLLSSIIVAQMVTEFTAHDNQSEIHSVADLDNAIVASVEGTTAYNYLRENSVGSIVTFEDINTAYKPLINGKVDAIVFDYADIAELYNRALEEGYNPEIVEKNITSEFYGIAVNKDYYESHPDIVNQINKSILNKVNSGEIVQLRQKWFDPIVTETKVNYSAAGH